MRIKATAELTGACPPITANFLCMTSLTCLNPSGFGLSACASLVPATCLLPGWLGAPSLRRPAERPAHVGPAPVDLPLPTRPSPTFPVPRMRRHGLFGWPATDIGCLGSGLPDPPRLPVFSPAHPDCRPRPGLEASDVLRGSGSGRSARMRRTPMSSPGSDPATMPGLTGARVPSTEACTFRRWLRGRGIDASCPGFPASRFCGRIHRIASRRIPADEGASDG
jgi:hypothetical protein